MVRRPGDGLPSSKTLTRHAKDLGPTMWHEYRKLREKYKKEGLTPKEALERAATELRLMELWTDWHERKEFREASGANVPLTPEEMKQVIPSYVAPTETRAEEVGEQELSFAEEIIWARDQRAMVENGAKSPTVFPSKGALSWYQYSLKNREKFMGFVASVSKPAGDGENLYLQDGQYQFGELEKQIDAALLECGGKLVELEEGFVEILKGAEVSDA